LIVLILQVTVLETLDVIAPEIQRRFLNQEISEAQLVDAAPAKIDAAGYIWVKPG
jgi:hypothetical protein